MNLRALTLCAGWLCGLVVGSPAATGRIERPVVTVSNPPPVRMLVPGFTVRELPLVLNNINNLVFAPDGRLFALCYDGNVLQLKDTNGDGLEDAFTYFYRNDRNEILPSIGMCWGPGGLYIASQRRVIRLRDQGDGTAELLRPPEEYRAVGRAGWIAPGTASQPSSASSVVPLSSQNLHRLCQEWECVPTRFNQF